MNYIVIDIEATCDDTQYIRNEIIEIGALKFDDYGNYIDKFDIFIKPIINPKLTKFCKKLTTIKQSDVNSAQIFPDVLNNFKSWIGKDYILCSWGFYDKNQFIKDCIYHKLSPDWTEKYISLKHQYAEFKRLKKPIGIENALKNENIEHSGIAHRGIDDAKNIGKIFVKYFEYWNFEV